MGVLRTSRGRPESTSQGRPLNVRLGRPLEVISGHPLDVRLGRPTDVPWPSNRILEDVLGMLEDVLGMLEDVLRTSWAPILPAGYTVLNNKSKSHEKTNSEVYAEMALCMMNFNLHLEFLSAFWLIVEIPVFTRKENIL